MDRYHQVHSRGFDEKKPCARNLGPGDLFYPCLSELGAGQIRAALTRLGEHLQAHGPVPRL